MKVPLIDLTAQHARIRDDVMAAAREVIESQRFVLGEPVARFERTIARVAGARFAAGVASGSDALVLALRALGVGEGDAVITTPLTFVATVEAIVRAGARPIFADVDPESLTLDPDDVERAVARAPSVRAILPVHLFGRRAAMTALGEIARARSLALIEDAAQAIGVHDGAAGIGDAACFSFFPAKTLGAWGDGGAVASDDEAVIARVKSLRQHGLAGPDALDAVGMNSRLDALHAAVLDAKARHLATWTAERRAAAERYRALLAGIDAIALPRGEPHVYGVYAIRTAKRDALRAHLAERGIESRAYYATPMHRQPAYARFHDGGALANAEAASGEILALPMFAEITEAQQGYVAEAVRGFFTS